MHNRIIPYIALLFLWEVTTTYSLAMVLSDAQPIQFWPVECDTFNQHEADGVHHRCFCQPFQCDDEIIVQGTVAIDSSPPVSDDYSLQFLDESGNLLLTLPFEVSENALNFVYTVSFIPSALSPEICDTFVQLKIVNDTTVTDIAKSDCIEIASSHANSILITYRNHRNFAGLVYEDLSPPLEFHLRIPAIFYHQRFPEEDETMELSTSLVSLNGVMHRQRLLDTDYLPYYMHEKIKFVLKHQFVTVFDKEWVKQEAYEIENGERRWPIKKARCWMSEKDFVHRNVL